VFSEPAECRIIPVSRKPGNSPFHFSNNTVPAASQMPSADPKILGTTSSTSIIINNYYGPVTVSTQEQQPAAPVLPHNPGFCQGAWEFRHTYSSAWEFASGRYIECPTCKLVCTVTLPRSYTKSSRRWTPDPWSEPFIYESHTYPQEHHAPNVEYRGCIICCSQNLPFQEMDIDTWGSHMRAHRSKGGSLVRTLRGIM
jgi:hypothetical protein